MHGALASAEVLEMTHSALSGMWGYAADDIHLVAGPLYHAGPQGYATLTLFVGGTVVVMESWDARRFCELVADPRGDHHVPHPGPLHPAPRVARRPAGRATT